MGWNIGVIDAAEELDVDSKLHGTLGQKRAQNDAEWNCSGVRSPHPRRYALAQLRAILQRGQSLDQVNWSVLNDDTGNSSVVLGGYWLDDLVDFNVRNPVFRDVRARFRPEVVAKW